MSVMSSQMERAFPAGEESDESNDEWDIGYYSSKERINSEVNLSDNDNDNVSVLKMAITAGDVDLVQKLLDSGLDVETRLGFEWTPLMYAVHVAHYKLAKLFLDRGASANFSTDHYTVLMAACTANSPSEDKIAKCVALLLSRNADPNVYSRSRTTCLMLTARDGYCQVINLLVSHGAELNFQDDSGYTALMFAVQYGHEDAVLKLLQLGADKTIKTKSGNAAVHLAKDFKQTRIYKILDSQGATSTNGTVSSKAETVFKFLSRNPEPVSVSHQSSAKLCDLELLLHGLNLEHLTDIMMENDITWGCLLTMEKEDLEKIGITDPVDQKKVLKAIEEMHLNWVDLNTLTQLDNRDCGSEELYNFLISLRQQCCYLTETVQDVINRLPRSSSEIVLSLDPKKEAQAICTDLVTQTGDLLREVTCLKNLLSKMDPQCFSFHPPLPSTHSSVRKRVLKTLAVGVLTAGFLLLLSQARHYKVCGLSKGV